MRIVKAEGREQKRCGSDRGKRWLGWFESVLNGC